MLAASARYHHTHPDIIARQDAISLAAYRLQARRFALDYPGEPAPPDICDLPPGWLYDLYELSEIDRQGEQADHSRLMQLISAR